MSGITKKKQKPLPRVLGDMSDRLGPVFTLRLGSGGRPTVVVSESSAARKLFTANDISVSSRTTTTGFDLMSLGGSIFIFSPYGHYWRSMRKIATVKLLSPAGLDTFRHIWVSEIAHFVADLHTAAPAPVVEMNGRIFDAVHNIMLRVVVGKRYFGSGGGSDEARGFRRLIARFLRLISAPVPADLFPFLGKLDLGGYEKDIREAAEEMDGVMQGLLVEHKLRRRRREGFSGGGAGDEERDFMDLMMESLADEPEHFFDDDTMAKATSLVSPGPGLAEWTLVSRATAFSQA